MERERVLSPSLPSFFPALSLALVFARAPLSERLEQAKPSRSDFLSGAGRTQTGIKLAERFQLVTKQRVGFFFCDKFSILPLTNTEIVILFLYIQRYKDTMIWFNVSTRSLQTETLLTVRKRSWPIYKLKKTVIRERVLVENKTGRSFRMFKFRASSFHAKNKNKVETIIAALQEFLFPAP